jgi:hypothetical protein
MADPIDPRLYAPSLPPRSQPYTTAPQHNASHPYYLSTPTHQQGRHVSQQTTPLGPTLDPALAQTSPSGPEASPEDDEHDDDDDDGEHDGCVLPAVFVPDDRDHG